MGNDDKVEDIDNEVFKSIEKLVEEETNVAKASFGNIENANMPQTKTNEEKSVVNLAKMKTQVMPSAQEVAQELEGKTRDLSKALHDTAVIHAKEVSHRTTEHMNTITSSEDIQNQDEVMFRPAKAVRHTTEEQAHSSKTPVKNKNVSMKTTILCAVVFVAVVMSVSASFIIFERLGSYEYNLKKGNEYVQNHDYREAVRYLNRAYGTEKGKNDTDLMYTIADCYKQNNDENAMKNMLEAILAVDKNNEKALSALGTYYTEKKDTQNLDRLLETYEGTEGEQYLRDFRPKQPEASIASGEYHEKKEIEFTADAGCKIYYTLDGSEPGPEKNEYKDTIEIESGTTIVRAISVNIMDIQSDIAEYKYEITYKQPNAPIILPAAGAYKPGETVTIQSDDENVIYYTTDNTTPTPSSNVYIGPFDMPEGNVIISAIAVNKQELSSSVARKNYIVQASRNISQDEAIAILQNRMRALNLVNENANQAIGGGDALYTPMDNVVIGEEGYFVIRYEIIVDGTVTSATNYAVSTKDGQTYRLMGADGSYEVTNF